MGMVDRKIIQTRNYIDPNKPAPPNLNYEEVFPISVFDAIRKDMNDENSETLTESINHILELIQSRQPVFPAKPSNYLMTYAGVMGGIGSIQMTTEIPWNPNSQSDDKIPTEKAVGDLIQKLGLVDENGELISPDRAKVRYSDIIGRPLIYEELGDNTDGYIHQKGITKAFTNVDMNIDAIRKYMATIVDALNQHTLNTNNPHAVTIGQIGAASAEVLADHLKDFNNPHQVDKIQIGLGNVDNTADMDKPISNATQKALDELKDLLNVLSDDANGFLVDIDYDQASGEFTATYNNHSYIKLLIPIHGLVDEIRFDKAKNILNVHELSGDVKPIDLSTLFIRYIGSISSSISIEIDGDQETGEQIIRAIVTPKGITNLHLDDGSVDTRVLADNAVTSNKIKDLEVITTKLADGSVTNEKVSINAITNLKIADRSVNGRTLFSSSIPNRVLVVKNADTDPIFGQINSDMIAYKAVVEDNLDDEAVTVDKIKDKAVTTEKLRDQSVTTEKISNKDVTNIKIADEAIDFRTIVPNVVLPGSPLIQVRPKDDCRDESIPDTRWVRDRIEEHVNLNYNYGDRSVDGRVLFSSDTRHRVLAVLRAGSDPVWTQVDDEMLAPEAVNTSHIVDAAVTSQKIASASIYNKHLTYDCVDNQNLKESSVTLDKVTPSNNANMVLAALKENGHPEYSQITTDMIAPNAITTDKIRDFAISLSKLESTYEPNRLLAVTIKGTIPQWTQANTEMIADGAITVNKIKEVPFRNMVLGSQSANGHPLWTKINGDMILKDAIVSKHILEKAINGSHIADESIETKHIAPYQVTGDRIAPNAVTGAQLFESEYPNRVLAVTDPYSPAEWLQVDTDMIRDKAITRDKIFRSSYPYRVLGVTQVGVAPEYIKITNDFIMDDTIRPQKLIRDFVLYGNPTITTHPSADADGYEIPDTNWVRNTISETMKDFHPDILFDTIDTAMIKDRAVGPTKLFTSSYPGPKVLGVTAPGDDPEYLRIEEDMIVDGSITRNKLERSIHLLGSPSLEVRPSPGANDGTGEGSLIPDVQWVLDRIAEGGGSSSGSSSGSSTGVPSDGSVTTVKIQNRAITADKLFTTAIADRVLAVTSPNANPIYTRVNANMMDDDSIEPRTIFKSDIDNTVMISSVAGNNPIWGKINIGMMLPNSVGTSQIVDESITGDKIINHTITRDKFKDVAFVDDKLLFDNAVTNSKILDGAVSRSKIAENAIDGSKIDKDLELHGSPTVVGNTNYKKSSVRNIVISPDAPTGGNPGDIWIRYI